MVTLAFFNLGGEEILFVLLLLTLFFGAERIPKIARQLGQWRAQFDAAKDRAMEELKTAEERELDAQLKFERAREHQMSQQAWEEPAPEAGTPPATEPKLGKEEP